MTPRPWTLPAAAWLAAGETAALIAALGLGGRNGAPLYIAFLTVKFPFCWLLVRRSPGAWLALVAWEVAGMVAALAAGGASPGLRVAEVLMAGGVVALLVASTPLFPAVQLPGSS